MAPKPDPNLRYSNQSAPNTRTGNAPDTRTRKRVPVNGTPYFKDIDPVPGTPYYKNVPPQNPKKPTIIPGGRGPAPADTKRKALGQALQSASRRYGVGGGNKVK